MTEPPRPPYSPSPAPSLGEPQRRRPSRWDRALIIGLAIGVLVPLAAFGSTALLGLEPATAEIGSTVWAVVAFSGVVMTAFHRTRRLGVGVLLGFCALVVVGAGTCTVAIMGFGGG